MREKRNRCRIDTADHKARHAVKYAECRIFRRARHLFDHERPVRRIEQHEIGVRATHIHAESITPVAHSTTLIRSFPRKRESRAACWDVFVCGPESPPAGGQAGL